MAEPRVIIIGAGPAGVRAAQTFVANGVRPIVIDEGLKSGGQIYRRQPDGFKRSYQTLYGKEAARALDIHETFESLLPNIDYMPNSLVWNISDGQIWVNSQNETFPIPIKSLIIATGATDRLLPIKGWQFSGCYSMGGAQIALKSQACAIGSEIVFLGSGPLLYLVAAQYVKAGANVKAILDTSSFTNRILALPHLMTKPDLLIEGINLTLYLKSKKVPIYDKILPIEICGDNENGVQKIIFRTKNNHQTEIKCDAIGMGWHLRPETQIADIAGCEFIFDDLSRQFLPKLDQDGRTSIEGIYACGDGAKILGARSAEVTGKLVALACLKDLGFETDNDQRNKLLKEKQTYVDFAIGLLKSFPWPYELVQNLEEDTIICRCENVNLATLRNSISNMSASETNRAKSFSRVGMGRCQGRYCGQASAEIIASIRAQDIKASGRLRTQAPVKPISVASIRVDK